MYARPAGKLVAHVPKRDWRERTIDAAPLPAPVVVHAGSECHVTPPHIAARMVGLVGALTGLDVLEPSAGTGNLARAILDAGAAPDRLTLVEMHTGLASGLRDAGLAGVVCDDFLQWAQTDCGRFGVIVMNPPFSRVRAHMAAARALLASRGVLVALVPVTFAGDGFDDLDMLPDTTFATAKVRTKLVRFVAD